MPIRALVLSILFLSSAFASANPTTRATRKAPAKSISIDPAAKVVLERVAKLYGATSRWKADIVQPPIPGAFAPRTYQYNISYARPNKLRIEQRFEKSSHVEVSVDADTAHMFEETTMSDFGVELSSYLQGKTGLNEALGQINSRNGISLNVKRLPDARWKGMKCQRVLVTKRFKPTEDEPTEMEKSESWFTPEGKWAKNIRAIKTKSFDPDFSFDDADIRTSEFRTQNFAPVFDSKTFKQPPPKMPF